MLLFQRSMRGAFEIPNSPLDLVARDAMRFLARLEGDGARIVNCPDYVRSWIAAENAVS